MEHCAIDLGSRESQICIRAEDGKIISEFKCLTPELGVKLSKRGKSRIIIETCTEAFAVADAMLEAGHEVRVVPASLVKSLGVGSHGVKNDVRDAQILSEVSCRIDLPSVHIPSSTSRQLKELCNLRETMTSVRTQLVQVVRSQLRTRLRNFRVGGPSTLPARVRKHFAEHREEVPPHFERVLVAIEAISQQQKEATVELDVIAKDNDICKRLMTAPGVGTMTAVRFVAAIDDIGRFPDAHRLESYLGLTPGQKSSSQRNRMTGITKAGPTALRWLLGQAAWSAWRTSRSDPMVLWAKQVAKRRGNKIAITALSRKLAGVLFAMWRDGENYNPIRLGKRTGSEGRIYQLRS